MPLDDEPTQFAKLSLEERLADDGIAVDGRLVQSDERVESAVDAFFEAHDLVFANQLLLVEFEIGLDRTDLVLANAQLLYRVTIPSEFFFIGCQLLGLFQLLLVVTLLSQFDLLELALQHFGLFDRCLAILTLSKQLLD